MSVASQTKQPVPGMKTFYVLALTQTLSMLGSRMSGFAIALWVTQQTGNATPLAMVTFFSLIPMVLLSNVAGMIVDRYDRRRVMALSDAGQAVGTVILFLIFASGSFQLWHLYAVTLLQATFGVFQGPAMMATVTMLVPDNHRDRSNALLQVMGPLAGIFAPAVSAALYVIIGVTGLLVVDFVTFIVAVTVVSLVHIPRPERSEHGAKAAGSMWKELAGGFQFLRANPLLFSIMLYASLINIMGTATGALFVPYVLARTDSAAIVGLVSSMESLGAVAGAVIISAWGGTRPRIHTILPGIIAAGLFQMIFGVSQHPALLIGSIFLMMLPLTMVNASFMSLLQSKVPADMQGRVFALMSQVAMALSPLGLLLIGPLADKVFEPAVLQSGWQVVAPLVGASKGAGMGLLILIAGTLTAIGSIAFYAIPRVRHLEAIVPDANPQPAAPTAEVESPSSDSFSGTVATA